MKMKFLISSSLFAVALVCILISCHKPIETEPVVQNTTQGTIQPKFGSDNLYLDSVYTLQDGTKIKVEDIKFYSSAVTSDETVISDYTLFDYRTRGSLWFKNTSVIAINSPGISYAIGIDAVNNHADPSTFPSSSWLNTINANDMYWSWNSGFIFAKIEGKADTIVDGTDNFDLSFSYHLGNDENFIGNQIKTVTPVKVSSTLVEYRLKMDIQSFFENSSNPINIATEHYTHSASGTAALTEKVKLNFAACITPL
jgi:hypothetical protein